MTKKKALLTLAGLATAGIVALVLTAVVHWLAEPDPRAIYRDAVVKLQSTRINAEGDFWVGDVAELYRQGRVSRRVAEADTAPITPLVDRPRAFHGYFVRAMESGPKDGGGMTSDTVSLKGKKIIKGTCAFCIYPADASRRDLPMWIVCPTGVFTKLADGSVPLEWPKDPKDCFSWGRLD